MPMRFDATLKDMAQDDPVAFVSAFDEPPQGPVAILNVDLSTVTAAADLVFGIGDPLAKVVHIDCQSRAQKDLGANILHYNALLFRRLRVPVHSVALLLHPRAQHAEVTGRVAYGEPAGKTSMDFRYAVVKLWERPVEELLKSPPSLLPLATLGRLPDKAKAAGALANVVSSILRRLSAEVEPSRFRRLATAAYVLTGMKVQPNIAKSMFLGVEGMQDSSTYQAILDEGREEGLKKGRIQGVQRTLLRQGRKLFGEPDKASRQTLEAIKSVSRLERLSERLLTVDSWEELLSQS